MAARKARKRAGYHHGDLRQALIDIAAELVREHGAAAFSLREAARRVGVDPAACYRHFRNRQELLIAIAQHGFGELAARMVEVRKEYQGPERLAAMARIYVGYALDQPAYFRVMFGDSGVSAQDERTRPQQMSMSSLEMLELDLAEWSAAAGLELDPKRAALTLWSAVHGVARLVVDGAVELSRRDALALAEEACRCVSVGLSS